MAKCRQCNSPIVGRTKRAAFCSHQCKEQFFADRSRSETLKRLAGRECVACGKPLISASGKAKTCSRACGVAWQNAKRRALQLAAWNARKEPCPRCGEELPESRWGAIYCSPRCKKLTMDARWRDRSPGYNRQHLYGITPEEYVELLAKQDGRCAICGTDTPNGKGTWHVDHDHETKTVRGLLCHSCNIMLGMARDDPARLQAAIAYLSR